MANLAKDTIRGHNVHTPQLLPLPVKAGSVLYANAIVATDANGLAVRGADTAGLTVQGVAYKGYDNSGGADGVLTGGDQFDAARYVQVDQVGEWEFAVSGAAPKPGQSAYVVDDNTVSAAATVNNLKLGRFTRPGNVAGSWFVDIERR